MQANAVSEIAQNRRALVVEDDEQTAYLLEFLLNRAGFDVAVARSGRDAQNLLEAEAALDIVLLDLVLPQVDGFQLLMQIRERTRYSNLPVVILSAKSLETDVIRAFELGADDYISKPFRPAELIARLNRLSERRRSVRVP
jgi:DNA-binding response OmpR family regulator